MSQFAVHRIYNASGRSNKLFVIPLDIWVDLQSRLRTAGEVRFQIWRTEDEAVPVHLVWYTERAWIANTASDWEFLLAYRDQLAEPLEKTSHLIRN